VTRRPAVVFPLLKNLFAERGGRVLAVGFVAIELLITLLIGISLYSMSDIRQNLDKLSVLLQARRESLAAMRENLYLRLASSRDMMLMEDVFEIDEEAQRFHVYAARIGQAYTRFMEQTEERDERALAEKFMNHALMGMPVLNRAVNELVGGRRSAEIRTLLTKAFESQKDALETLAELQDLIENHAVAVTTDAVARYERTRVLILFLTIVAILSVLTIAVIVARLIVRHTAEIEDQHRRYKTLFDANRDAVLIVEGTMVREGNRRALEWFDKPNKGNLADVAIDSLSMPQDDGSRDGILGPLRRIGTEGGDFQWVFRDRYDQPFFGEVSVSALPVLDQDRYQLVIRDVTERTLALRRISHEAAHDSMTGLANRREFERRARSAIDMARATGGPHVLCFMDLDRFKDVNDLAGHDAGDELLKHVAELFRSRIRAADLVARLGGDEFGLLLENCSIDRASSIVREIISAIEGLRFQSRAGELQIGVSVGMVGIHETAPPYEQLVRAADEACYEAKRSGTRLTIASLETADLNDRS